jgi:DNA mismatch repair protein MutL
LGKIQLLAKAVADQIAAGEVVERPASVVKELVENALDAGAGAITVDLEDGGCGLIRVIDDGAGMDAADALLAVERHATSKIRIAADLVGVSTYGFRGEALSAIASVSRFELETATAGSGGGTRLVIHGGRLEKQESIARQPGTTITVRQLFYNTPARRKFLKSQRCETRAAVEALTTLALGRLDLQFRLSSDGRTLLDAPPVASVADRIALLFGSELCSQLIPVDRTIGDITVRGFIQRPSDARPSGRKTFLFVNGRPFRDPFLIRSAEAGYRATIHPGARPTIFLSLSLSGEAVDVNVHPAKLEVRFRERMLVERAVEYAVRDALQPLGAAATVGNSDGQTVRGLDGQTAGWSPQDRYKPSNRPTPSFHSGQAVQPSGAPSLFDGDASATPTWFSPRAVVQVFDTYLIFETPDGVAIVDQHSAHERVLYERTMAQLSGNGTAAQRLLLPLTVELTNEEHEAVEQHHDLLLSTGFEVEPFGGRTVVIHAVPNPHPRFDAKHCFQELAADLARGRFGGWHNRLERFAATYACRAAIKAGQSLGHDEIRDLLARLFACELPPHDVHGRPTIVQLPKDELERRFGRA